MVAPTPLPAPQREGPRPVPARALSPLPTSATALPSSGLRLPAFIAFGVGGLSAGGAVVTGLVGSFRHDDPKLECGRYCERKPETDQTLAVTTRVLAGVAAASVSAGLVLLLASPKERPSFTPSLGVNVSGTKATAKAIWRF